MIALVDSGVPRTSDGATSEPLPAELAAIVSTFQAELLAVKAQNESLRETLLNLSHENELLKRRIYGNKTERTQTSELQLTLGSILDAEKQLQKALDEAVAKAHGSDGEGGTKPPADKPKPKGRRDLSTSDLPRFLLEILDEDLEKSAKRIGFDESLQLMFRHGGFSVLVKRTAKYELPGRDGPTVLGVETPKTLFRRGLLHSSVVAHILVQKFSLGVPHHRLEQHLADQGVELGRGIMCRYVEEAGSTLGATIVRAAWQDAIQSAGVSQPTRPQPWCSRRRARTVYARPARKGISSPPSSTATTCCSRTPSGIPRTSSRNCSTVSTAFCNATPATSTTSSTAGRRRTPMRACRSSAAGRIAGATFSRQPCVAIPWAYKA